MSYTMCGGCGATHPDQRCIGCLHNFGGGSWDTSKIYEKDHEDRQSQSVAEGRERWDRLDVRRPKP